MRQLTISLSLAAVTTLGACSREQNAPGDDALKTDLALAAQVQPYQAQQFVSPNEQILAGNVAAQSYAPAPRAAQPVYRAPARRTATRSTRSTARSTGSQYPSVPSAPREVQRHTVRDAAIGAAAGAVIGATTSRDKVKGGLIGAAAGGILGGIIGHTIDVKRPN